LAAKTDIPFNRRGQSRIMPPDERRDGPAAPPLYIPCREPSMPERTPHQQRIIKNYYNNRDAISLQRLQELVTELYLADGKRRAKQWEYIVAVLEKLKIPKSRIENLVKQDNPALVAQLVEELMQKK
jgi:hypothetical protein